MSARYELIDAEKATVTAAGGGLKYSIVKMCEWLGVSSSGYYEWQGRQASATAARRDRLKVLIAEVFTDSDGTYGHRRVHAQLARWGEHASLELVRGLMRELGLVACQPRPWRHSLTEADAAPAPIPDLVRRDFTAEAPGRKMVGDITYIPTWEGWVYLATVIDCHTKAVVGWAVDDNYRTPLISTAIRMAARNHDHAWCGLSFRPGQQLYVGRVRGGSDGAGHSAVGRADRDLLRQCDGGIVLRCSQDRAGAPHPVPHPRTRPPGYCPLHRVPLQYQASPLGTRLQDPARDPRRVPQPAGRSIGNTFSNCPENAGLPTPVPVLDRCSVAAQVTDISRHMTALPSDADLRKQHQPTRARPRRHSLVRALNPRVRGSSPWRRTHSKPLTRTFAAIKID